MAADADWRSAEWAERHGLYARLADNTHELDERVSGLARKLAASNPEATARLKQVFWEGTREWETMLAERAEMSGTLVLSEFTRKAIASFQAR